MARKFFQTTQYRGPARLGRFRTRHYLSTPALLIPQVPSLHQIRELPGVGPGSPTRWLAGALELAVEGAPAPHQFATTGDFTTPGAWIPSPAPGDDPLYHLLAPQPAPRILAPLELAVESHARHLDAIEAWIQDPHFADPGPAAFWLPWHVVPDRIYQRRVRAFYAAHRARVAGIQLVDPALPTFRFRNYLKTVAEILAVRSPNTPVLLTGPVYPHQYALLVYLGVDLLDATGVLVATHERRFLTESGVLEADDVAEVRCRCPACLHDLATSPSSSPSPSPSLSPSPAQPAANALDLDLDPDVAGWPLARLLLHNLLVAREKLGLIRHHLRAGTFRSFVEAETHWDATSAACLRVVDRRYQALFRAYTPRVSTGTMRCIGAEAYHRPDVAQYRAQAVARFEPFPDTRLVLLLPCAARKPYSESRSHRKFRDAVRARLKRERHHIQEFVLTSPLGVIPRQLETIFPVNAYDIPVTGDWDAEETQITADMVAAFLRRYPADLPIVAHLGGGYRAAVELAIDRGTVAQDVRFTAVAGSESSRESLRALQDVLADFQGLTTPPRRPLGRPGDLVARVKSLIDYQFGPGAGRAVLAARPRLKRSRRRRRITLQGAKTTPGSASTPGSALGHVSLDHGTFTPSLAGAELLREHTPLRVTFDGTRLRGSSLFCQGVTRAASEIQPGDVVLVLDAAERAVVGVGEAIVPGHLMGLAGEGPVVALIHKRRGDPK